MIQKMCIILDSFCFCSKLYYYSTALQKQVHFSFTFLLNPFLLLIAYTLPSYTTALMNLGLAGKVGAQSSIQP